MEVKNEFSEFFFVLNLWFELPEHFAIKSAPFDNKNILYIENWRINFSSSVKSASLEASLLMLSSEISMG
jgi:hypothetical protein